MNELQSRLTEGEISPSERTSQGHGTHLHMSQSLLALQAMLQGLISFWSILSELSKIRKKTPNDSGVAYNKIMRQTTSFEAD